MNRYTFALDLVLALPDILAPWQNPYFNTEQRVVQNVVTVGGVGAGTAIGAWAAKAAITAGLGGPATFAVVTVTGVAVIIAWEGVVKPVVSFVAPAFGRRSPYQEYRNFSELGGQQ